MRNRHPDVGFGLQSWSTLNPPAALDPCLVSSVDDDYDSVVVDAAYTIFANLDSAPSVYLSQFGASF